MSSRPTVQVHGGSAPARLALPTVFNAPIRTDVVRDVHTKMAKNRRQAYAVAPEAGHQTSAHSWGTGRALARIPRVGGSGTHRSGQGAFGNMCRKGRMFAPTKTWRKWHVKISQGQRRYAVCAALAATAVPALVMARGHRVANVPEIPLVVSDEAVKDISKTKQAVDLLKSVGAYDDVERAKASRKLRAGKGKLRNRRFVSRRGPLVVYSENSPLVSAFRNLPGVELCAVSRLNLLQLAPGGHVGRFVIWTSSAFKQLNAVFGTWTKKSQQKSNFTLPRPLMVNADLARIINSDEVQSHVRPQIRQKKYHQIKKNPLTNLGVRVKLDPFYATSVRRNYLASQKTEKSIAKRKELNKKSAAKHKDERKAFKARLVE